MNEDAQPAVIVSGLHKTFKLPHEKHTSLKSLFVNLLRPRTYEKQKVLNNVSFEIQKGEFFGIVGRNGSGKSTLLKILAGIYQPTKGNVSIKGSLVPFIELGVGFNPELTGRENVYLNGALLGFSRRDMNKMYKDIVSFAELESFMDQKLKNYSSGMQVRLAFSIAIRAQGDILLLDEVLAVGDSAFQQKCYDYFSSLKQEKRTIILVSHNMQAVEQFCDRALLLESGKIKKIGDSTEIGNMYEQMFMREELEKLTSQKHETRSAAGEFIKILSTKVKQEGRERSAIDASKDFEVEVELKSSQDIDNINVGLNIKNHSKNMLVSADTNGWHGMLDLKKNEKKTVSFSIQNILTNGVHTVNLGIADHNEALPKLIVRADNAAEFMVKGRSLHAKSLTHPKIKVSVE